jgi:hypothetical protein
MDETTLMKIALVTMLAGLVMLGVIAAFAE